MLGMIWRRRLMKLRVLLTIAWMTILTCTLAVQPASAQEAGEKTFASPKDAAQALYAAVKADDKPAMLAVLGPSASNIIESGDQVQDKNNRESFLHSFDKMNRWEGVTTGEQVLYIGADNWPFPIPLKKAAAGQWYFNTKAGLQEILFRRIGKNELATIRVCRALVQAQQEYFQQTHDGDTTHQYAQKFISDAGKQDGLYWKTADGEPGSPIGPLVAFATAKGYGGQHDSPQPFYGYYYRMLAEQGANAPGGAKSYLVDRKMTGGFAFVAYAAEYRNSGVMTFLVDESGVVYQKDLGANTADIASQMKSYNPDKTWVTAETGDDTKETN